MATGKADSSNLGASPPITQITASSARTAAISLASPTIPPRTQRLRRSRGGMCSGISTRSLRRAAVGRTMTGFDGDSKEVEKVFDMGVAVPGSIEDFKGELSAEREDEKLGVDAALEEEKELGIVLKGPDRAVGDLMSASGITESMLDSLIILKDLEDVQGLPPLSEIEDMRLAKSNKKNIRAEIERKKQEEIVKTYVRRVDDKGRAYGTGRRKCGIARVWIQPGDGKFIINDKPLFSTS